MAGRVRRTNQRIRTEMGQMSRGDGLRRAATITDGVGAARR